MTNLNDLIDPKNINTANYTLSFSLFANTPTKHVSLSPPFPASQSPFLSSVPNPQPPPLSASVSPNPSPVSHAQNPDVTES